MGVNAPNQVTRITFPEGTAVDETVEMELTLSATDAVGRVTSSATVEMPGGTGEISGLGFNVEAGDESKQPGGLSPRSWLGIFAGLLLVIVLLLRGKKR